MKIWSMFLIEFFVYLFFNILYVLYFCSYLFINKVKYYNLENKNNKKYFMWLFFKRVCKIVNRFYSDLVNRKLLWIINEYKISFIGCFLVRMNECFIDFKIFRFIKKLFYCCFYNLNNEIFDYY